ncbi:MAG: RNA polymerase sigma-70 factor [Odoribacteraceae bacterium]|jgi:RNA polymerase sigma-70 factor (ECF subfamily)|nr:RNA polymerase sigma-70 factor [Odoribacteraceae bacterium]
MKDQYRNDSEGEERRRFETLFKTHYAPLCNYVQAILGDFDEAEDVVQELFAHLWDDRKERTIVSSEKSYLYASARYRALNVLKHKAVMQRNNPLLVDFIESVQQEGYSEEEERAVEEISRVIGELPPRCREIFTKSCLEGKSYKEIADEAGISINTVKYHVKQAYKAIHAVLQPPITPLLLLLSAKSRF